MSVRQVFAGWIVALGLVAGWATAAQAIIVFDYDSLSDGASNTSVRNYMRGVLQAIDASMSVNVSGAKGEQNYTGDNHVTGPVNGTVRSKTLGTSDGGVMHAGFDTFIVNRTDTDRITMTFNFPIYAVSFDYEIFPDAHVPNGTQTNNTNPVWPDFTFKADGVTQFHTLGVMPGTNGIHPHSPFSGAVNDELAPQYIGHSGTWEFSGGVTTLEFIDWPRMVGIDNLNIHTERPIPEPATLWLTASGLVGLLARRRHRTHEARKAA